jgi:hypothetical protein
LRLLVFLRNTSGAQASRIIGLLLGEEESERDWDGKLVLGQGQRNETLTGCNLSDLPRVLTSDPDRFGTEFRQTRIVNDQDGFFSSQHLFSSLGEEGFQRVCQPRTIGHEVLEMIFLSKSDDSR